MIVWDVLGLAGWAVTVLLGAFAGYGTGWATGFRRGRRWESGRVRPDSPPQRSPELGPRRRTDTTGIPVLSPDDDIDAPLDPVPHNAASPPPPEGETGSTDVRPQPE